MNEIIRDIGNRVKELRELSDVSVDEMASHLKVDNEKYLKFENGEVDIPVSVLYEIAHVLKVDMGLFLSGEETRMHIFHITRAGKGRVIEKRKGYFCESLADRFIHKKAETLEVTIQPTKEKPVINSHSGQEFNYVIEGSLKLYIHNHELILNKGDSIFFDSTYGHAMEALENKPAKFLAVII
ncbi:MAG: cupin domain-containing protein [Methanobrevibacter sp.]|jgi:transcriptional regulator with XRE-family HTH domain|nr:cupin domain-containing protein [Methanobrevibacter sp.]